MSVEEQTQEMKEYMIALLDGRNIPEDALNDIVVRASRHFAKAQNDGYHEGYAAGRASMKAEIVKAIEETPRQHHSELGYNGPIGWWTVKTSDLLTRIERTET